ncbi:MAG: cyclic pyranopterin monophosphate synthase MoaC [Candidatus Hinthialibacter antarcticus]|nr:cyclic pyranopterin monophosphate synthase MoaC [Candidatus Hinthialibacter antarcticus]
MQTPFTHISPEGEARMVNVGAKAAAKRSAVAEAWVTVGPAVSEILHKQVGLTKGNVIETARLAGIMGAKRTADLIPLCHPLAIEVVDVKAELIKDRIRIRCRVECEAKTGVEMEAMTAASIAALTVYDMVKSAEKGVEIGPIRLLEKHGGKSGDWFREADKNGDD